MLLSNKVTTRANAATQMDGKSIVTDSKDRRGSNKQTVYVMHSSRKKLETTLDSKLPHTQQ